MRSCRTMLAALTLPLLLGSCQPRAEQRAAGEGAATEADRAALEEILRREIEAFTSEDTDALLSLFTDDAVVMPPNDEARVGKEEARAWLEELHGQVDLEGAEESVEVMFAGDWAFQRVSFELTLTPEGGGEPVEDRGTGVHIYRRQPDGSWKIHWDIWNSDRPPPAP